MTRKRLGEMLIEAGAIDEAQLQAALGHQRRWGGRIGRALVELKFVTEDQIVEALAKKFDYEIVPADALAAARVPPDAVALVPREFAEQHGIVPWAIEGDAKHGSISIAMSDPSNVAAADELRFRTGRKVKIGLAGDRAVQEAIRAVYYGETGPEAVEAISVELDGSPDEAPVMDRFMNDTGAPAAAAGVELSADIFGEIPAAKPAVAAPRPAPGPAPRDALDDILPPSPQPAHPAVTGIDDLFDVPAAKTASARDELFGAVPAGGLREETGPVPTLEVGDSSMLEPVEPEPAPIPAPAPAPAPARAAPPPPPPPAAPALHERELTDKELAVLDALEHLAAGEAPLAAEIVKPAQMAAALLRLLIKKKLISEVEFLEELARK